MITILIDEKGYNLDEQMLKHDTTKKKAHCKKLTMG